MGNELEMLAKTLLQTPQGKHVLGNLDKLKSYTESAEGQQFLSQLAGGGGDALKQAAAAAQGGDREAAGRLISTLLASEDGAKLATSLMQLLQK
ncbi:hypothetical protein LJC32_00395 [Oscillospiraceae bacterium OttesenSCG-928-F05]|nr:hypothetical protein [Oscillospiraceae bacterium OttesenSCG-928-F05]